MVSSLICLWYFLVYALPTLRCNLMRHRERNWAWCAEFTSHLSSTMPWKIAFLLSQLRDSR